MHLNAEKLKKLYELLERNKEKLTGFLGTIIHKFSLSKLILLLLLVGLLLTISGCTSASSPTMPPPKIHIDQSLLIEPNLTNQLLETLSQ